jgi:hypothetical protein
MELAEDERWEAMGEMEAAKKVGTSDGDSRENSDCSEGAV